MSDMVPRLSAWVCIDMMRMSGGVGLISREIASPETSSQNSSGIAFAKGLLAGISSEPAVILLVMIGVFILLGFFIDWIGILFLTMPIFLPTLQALGYDPIWFGILFNLSMQIAYLTPPFGPAWFYLKGVAPPEVTLQDIFAAQWPFIGLQVLALVLVAMFPQIALWLPNVLMGPSL